MSLTDLQFSGVKVRNVTGITLPNNTPITLNFDTLDHDTDNYYTPNVPTQVVTPVAGYYEIEGQVAFAGNTLGSRHARILVAGSIVGAADAAPAALINGGKVTVRATQQFVDVSKAIQLVAYQNSGANLNTFSGTYPDQVVLAVRLLGVVSQEYKR